MKKLSLGIVLLGLVSVNTYAGAKSDFINAVKAQCGKSDAEAKKMATPGRSGNVIKFKTCSSDSINIDGCKLVCKGSAQIGG